jgi:hypothetical protein
MGLHASRTTPRDKIGSNFTSLYDANGTAGTLVATANAVRGGMNKEFFSTGARLTFARAADRK